MFSFRLELQSGAVFTAPLYFLATGKNALSSFQFRKYESGLPELTILVP